ncbi:hypothetical protein CGZ88_0715 [Bifidobacterium anseris]|uniref:PIN like domain-containing protein n=1 Tax=Bifidobacterium anseris TaxID=2020963 RepID=A0A2N5J2Z0_9BIFI|nr:hypothetical protein [Bifidobacterium anseris]PLS28553.1 hypothetical protein CGZ88_0715 [Bifidobacterium anseris]
MQRIGKYSIIKNGEFKQDEADVVILDSNVLIDIDKFYYRGASSQSREDLRALLHEFRKVDDLDYRYALMETCFKRTKCDAAHAVRMRNAIREMWIEDLEKIDMMLACESVIAGEGEVRSENLFMESIFANIIKLPDVFYVMYGTNLHMIMMYEKNQKDRGKAYSEHCRWVREELNCVSAYPRMVARSLFLGQSEENGRARALLKIDKKRMSIEDKAWNSAWDCFFMFVLDAYRMGEVGIVDEKWEGLPARVVLITARDQVWIDSMSHFCGYGQKGKKKLPFLQNTLHIRKDYLETAHKEEELDQGHHCRVLDEGGDINNVFEAIVRLENELNILPRTIFDIG